MKDLSFFFLSPLYLKRCWNPPSSFSPSDRKQLHYGFLSSRSPENRRSDLKIVNMSPFYVFFLCGCNISKSDSIIKTDLETLIFEFEEVISKLLKSEI